MRNRLVIWKLKSLLLLNSVLNWEKWEIVKNTLIEKKVRKEIFLLSPLYQVHCVWCICFQTNKIFICTQWHSVFVHCTLIGMFFFLSFLWFFLWIKKKKEYTLYIILSRVLIRTFFFLLYFVIFSIHSRRLKKLCNGISTWSTIASGNNG